MPPLHLTELNVYPIKSAGGIAAETWPVDPLGLRHDRRWMVIDNAGYAITQREQPRLALIRPCFRDESLVVEAPGISNLVLSLCPAWSVTTIVTVWDDRCSAAWLGPEPAEWFSTVLGKSCSLVYMPDSSVRAADPDYAPPGTRVSFADAFPFLMISEESLADLNSRMAKPLPMNRFRPNLVIAGGAAFVEDTMDRFVIGELSFRVVKPCDRCVLPTTDQETAERGREPLRTLASYRKRGSKVLFGQNVVHAGCGLLRVGDILEF
jgi:uncharacterized protein YcbX